MAENLSFLDTLGRDKKEFDLKEVRDVMTKMAVTYVNLISTQIDKQDIASSGRMQDLISPTELQVNGTTLSVSIVAPEYATYVDEGVDGWARGRGSKFKFKTKGVDPKGQFVKSIKSYLAREGKSARNVKVSISSREAKGKTMTDASTKAAVQTAYMIKKYGIKPRHFWTNATDVFKVQLAHELGLAFKIDIINSIT